jgi:hypothetical protein
MLRWEQMGLRYGPDAIFGADKGVAVFTSPRFEAWSTPRQTGSAAPSSVAPMCLLEGRSRDASKAAGWMGSAPPRMPSRSLQVAYGNATLAARDSARAGGLGSGTTLRDRTLTAIPVVPDALPRPVGIGAPNADGSLGGPKLLRLR